MISKSKKGLDYKGRFDDILSDPSNEHIPRHKDAGKIVDGHLIMHNGLKVIPKKYYDDFSKILELNKGVHEPQEERIFAAVLPYMGENGVMIELGAYWAFYSMWFHKEIKNARCYLIEPENKYLEVGRKNFELNDMNADFTLGKIGNDAIKIDDFLKTKGLESVDILHCDIQGAELEMLHGAKKSIKVGKIKYFFISSHSQGLHYKCMNFLKSHGYTIIASADFEKETYCYDGILVARLGNVRGLGPMNIESADWQSDSIFVRLVSRLPSKMRSGLYIQYYNFNKYRDIFPIAGKFIKKHSPETYAKIRPYFRRKI